MKLLNLFVITLFFYQFAFAQSSTLDRNLQKADSLWKSNHLNQAIEQYKLVIKQDSVPEAYQSLIYLRLAKAQFRANLLKECRTTLMQAKSLPVVPDHHRLIIEELEKKRNGVSTNERTPVPSGLKPAVILYVTSSANAEIKPSSSKK